MKLRSSIKSELFAAEAEDSRRSARPGRVEVVCAARPYRPVCTVALEHSLLQIDANRRNLRDGRTFRFEWLQIPPLWHVDAVKGGGVHPIDYVMWR